MTEKNTAERNGADSQDGSGSENGPYPVVGIGASAGGLAAFEAFFSGMPADTDPNMAFVLVQHLAPDHKSVLADLIRRHTRMEVHEVEDGMKVQVNHAYIIPPNRDMAFFDGALQLMEPVAPRGKRMPIDFFFRSLAQDRGEQAVGIVLSGTGSDGTLGIRAIKGAGGMAMAQAPDSAEYDGMPRSAIATGLVDWQLSPQEMPSQLVRYASQAFGDGHEAAMPQLPGAESVLKKIYTVLRAQTGHDCSHYKPSTTQRRVQRRMAVHQLESVDEYLKLLRNDPAEAAALFRDLLIGVTRFFRDPEAFRALEERVIPEILAGKSSNGVIRVWSAGCSTGEEAYSLAMLLAEGQEARKQRLDVQIFATDIDNEAITAARAGIYPASIAADISAERLARHFTAAQDGSTFRIHKNIRDMVIFSEQDMVRDPPFSKLDLISCRNVLIYMNEPMQKRLVALFHYALKPGGVLFLGNSETVGEYGDLFAGLDRRAKIYRRQGDPRGTQRTALWRYPATSARAVEVTPPSSSGGSTGATGPSLRALTEQALLNHMTAVAALVTAQGDVLYLHGRTGLYLEPSPGESGINSIFKMARPGLRESLLPALHRAAKEGESVHSPGVLVQTNGDTSPVDLFVHPVSRGGSAEEPEPSLYLVVLDKSTVATPASAAPASSAGASEDPRVMALEQELQSKEEYLKSTNERLETSNEELTSANEELQSLNEELQSTNEELETSKEELQSVNEELSTVNTELQSKVVDLSQANNDMNNLLAGTGIGTIFVDHALRILRFTPAATRHVNLIDSDVGRPLGHIAPNLENYSTLVEDTQAVLDTLVPHEVEVKARGGAWYSLRIHPYRTTDNVIEGAVITFVDISDLKRTQESLKQAQALADGIVATVRQPLAVLDKELRVVQTNAAFCGDFGIAQQEVVGRNLFELDGGEWAASDLRAWLDEVRSEGAAFDNRGLTHHFDKGGRRTMRVSARPISRPKGELELILLAFEWVGENGP